MRKIRNEKGEGLIGLLISIGILLLLIFGYWFMGKDKSPKNQIEAGKDAIDEAQNAADAQNQNTIYLQNEIQDSPPVNYHGIQDNLKNIKQ